VIDLILAARMGKIKIGSIIPVLAIALEAPQRRVALARIDAPESMVYRFSR
jgi:hypothetical protein